MQDPKYPCWWSRQPSRWFCCPGYILVTAWEPLKLSGPAAFAFCEPLSLLHPHRPPVSVPVKEGSAVWEDKCCWGFPILWSRKALGRDRENSHLNTNSWNNCWANLENDQLSKLLFFVKFLWVCRWTGQGGEEGTPQGAQADSGTPGCTNTGIS